MRDAEALLFIYNEQTEVFEAHVLLDEAVGADDDIHAAFSQAEKDLALLLRGAEAGEHLHFNREGREALVEGAVMLLGEDGGGHQDGNLFAIGDGFEGGAQGHLGLAVAHVAADQAIHGAGVLHVGLDFFDHAQLVFGLNIGEAGFQLLLPGGVGGEGVALDDAAAGIELKQILGHFEDGLFDAVFGVAPLYAAQARKLWQAGVGANVTGDAVGLVNGHVELVALGVFDTQVFAFGAVDGAVDQAGEAANAMIDVDDNVADLQVGIGGLGGLGGGAGTLARLGAAPAEELAIGEQVGGGEGGRGIGETLRQRAFEEEQGWRCVRGWNVLFGPQFLQAGGLARDDDDGLILGHQAGDVFDG